MDSYTQGLKLSAAGRHSEAIGAFERALRERPGDTRTLFALGNTARVLGMADAAGQFYRQVLTLEPGRLEAVVNLANLLRSQGTFDAAEALIRPALARMPDSPELLLTLGSLLRETGRDTEAMEHYRAALTRRPDYVPAMVNLADLEADCGRDREALALYDRALSIEPGNAQARLNRAVLHLLRGNLKDGWGDYNARLKIPGKVPVASHGLKRWDGQSLKRTRLLVTAEQGVGDHLMFASLIPDLAARARAEGGSLILECEPRLKSLFARSFEGVSVHDWQIETREGVARSRYGWLKAAGGANAAIELGSLPRWLRPSFDAFPSAHAYLKPDAEETARWQKAFQGLPRPWIAFSWRSGAVGGVRKAQYAEPGHWAAFLREMPGTPIAAQYGWRAEEIATFETMSGRAVTVPQNLDQKQELDRTAAMLSVCDAVVTAPTAVSWLSAAAGVPTFKVFADPSWAWTAFGMKNEPFAPAARCLIAKTRGDWVDVLDQALKAIKSLPV